MLNQLSLPSTTISMMVWTSQTIPPPLFLLYLHHLLICPTLCFLPSLLFNPNCPIRPSRLFFLLFLNPWLLISLPNSSKPSHPMTTTNWPRVSTNRWDLAWSVLNAVLVVLLHSVLSTTASAHYLLVWCALNAYLAGTLFAQPAVLSQPLIALPASVASIPDGSMQRWRNGSLQIYPMPNLKTSWSKLTSPMLT